MEAWMFRVLTLMAVLAGGGIGFASHRMTPRLYRCLPFRPLSRCRHSSKKPAGAASGAVRTTGPVVVVPDPGVAVDPDVEVEVDAEAPAVIFLPPPRPASCGQYRYWNGERCVDARYNTPYIGPR